MKRYRKVTAKDGELKLRYGKAPHDGPDICVAWGDGAGNNWADSSLLFHVFCQPRYGYNSRESYPSLVEELEKRGYDITTIKFSIQKKKVDE